jgi:hypothetical protein
MAENHAIRPAARRGGADHGIVGRPLEKTGFEMREDVARPGCFMRGGEIRGRLEARGHAARPGVAANITPSTMMGVLCVLRAPSPAR